MKQRYIISLCLIVCICCGLMLVECGHNNIEVSSQPVAATIPIQKPSLKVFIENSGSMDGYMCDGSQLKDAVYDYVSDLNRHTYRTDLYYINSQIIPYKGNLMSYIKDLNPSSFHKAGGNTSNTDLGDIIASVLKTVNDTTIALFVSDCILDLPAKDAQKFLTNCEIRIKDEVIGAQKRVPDLGIEIFKLYSDFNGKYFYPNGAVQLLKDVKRPYYIWVLGNKNYIAQLNSAVPFTLLKKYGLDGIIAFTNKSAVTYDIFNKNGTSKTIAPSKGDYHVVLKADFRTTLQPDIIVEDKNNYTFNNNLIIDEISPILVPKSEYTHFIKFTIPKGTIIAEDCLTFNTPHMPSWVSESNDETGTEINTHINKTTGIKYIIQGVADAYKNEKVSTTFKFNIKRK